MNVQNFPSFDMNKSVHQKMKTKDSNLFPAKSQIAQILMKRRSASLVSERFITPEKISDSIGHIYGLNSIKKGRDSPPVVERQKSVASTKGEVQSNSNLTVINIQEGRSVFEQIPLLEPQNISQSSPTTVIENHAKVKNICQLQRKFSLNVKLNRINSLMEQHSLSFKDINFPAEAKAPAGDRRASQPALQKIREQDDDDDMYPGIKTKNKKIKEYLTYATINGKIGFFQDQIENNIT